MGSKSSHLWSSGNCFTNTQYYMKLRHGSICIKWHSIFFQLRQWTCTLCGHCQWSLDSNSELVCCWQRRCGFWAAETIQVGFWCSSYHHLLEVYYSSCLPLFQYSSLPSVLHPRNLVDVFGCIGWYWEPCNWFHSAHKSWCTSPNGHTQGLLQNVIFNLKACHCWYSSQIQSHY